MNIDTSRLTLHLGPRQIVRLPHSRGARVACRRGTVWITQDEDASDIILAPGQVHASATDGLTLIYGLDDAEIDIEESATAA
ncbi:MAG: DUF2917 domain-containing protein [Burkholderiales bacterium]